MNLSKNHLSRTGFRRIRAKLSLFLELEKVTAVAVGVVIGP